MKSIFKGLLLKTLVPAGLLTATVIVSITPLGCKTSIEGLQMLEGDFSTPELQAICVTSEENISLSFTKEISVKKAEIILEEESLLINQIEYDDDCKKVDLTLPFQTEIGKKYTLEAVVADSAGNTLSQTCTFTGFNSRVPLLALTEVFNGYDKSKGGEYVELAILSDGNMAGLELLVAGDQKKENKGTYTFPALEVKKGNFVILHLRTNETWTGAVDEDEQNMGLSTAPYSSNSAIDLWVKNAKASIAYDDVIVLKNSANSKIIDALLFCQSASLENPWPDNYSTLLSQVEKSGIWLDKEGQPSSEKKDSIVDDATSKTHKSHFGRKKIPDPAQGENLKSSKEDWIFTNGTKQMSLGH